MCAARAPVVAGAASAARASALPKPPPLRAREDLPRRVARVALCACARASRASHHSPPPPSSSLPLPKGRCCARAPCGGVFHCEPSASTSAARPARTEQSTAIPPASSGKTLHTRRTQKKKKKLSCAFACAGRTGPPPAPAKSRTAQQLQPASIYHDRDLCPPPLRADAREVLRFASAPPQRVCLVSMDRRTRAGVARRRAASGGGLRGGWEG